MSTHSWGGHHGKWLAGERNQNIVETKKNNSTDHVRTGDPGRSPERFRFLLNALGTFYKKILSDPESSFSSREMFFTMSDNSSVILRTETPPEDQVAGIASCIPDGGLINEYIGNKFADSA